MAEGELGAGGVVPSGAGAADSPEPELPTTTRTAPATANTPPAMPRPMVTLLRTLPLCSTFGSNTKPAFDMFVRSWPLLRAIRPVIRAPAPQRTPTPTDDHPTILSVRPEPSSTGGAVAVTPGVSVPSAVDGVVVGPLVGAGGPTGAGVGVGAGVVATGGAGSGGGVAAAAALRRSSTVFSTSAILRSTSSRLRAFGARWR